MPQIITFSKVMVMYIYALKIIKLVQPVLVTTCLKRPLCALFAFLLQPSFQPAKISED